MLTPARESDQIQQSVWGSSTNRLGQEGAARSIQHFNSVEGSGRLLQCGGIYNSQKNKAPHSCQCSALCPRRNFAGPSTKSLYPILRRWLCLLRRMEGPGGLKIVEPGVLPSTGVGHVFLLILPQMDSSLVLSNNVHAEISSTNALLNAS